MRCSRRVEKAVEQYYTKQYKSEIETGIPFPAYFTSYFVNLFPWLNALGAMYTSTKISMPLNEDSLSFKLH